LESTSIRRGSVARKPLGRRRPRRPVAPPWQEVFRRADLDLLDGALLIANEKTMSQPEPAALLQQRLRAMLETFVRTRRVHATLDSRVLAGQALDVELALDQERGGPALNGSRGSFVATRLFAVAVALASTAGSRVRRCPDSKCARFFLRVGKMEYCSEACARRVYARKWYRDNLKSNKPKSQRT
jgi:predicted RNA-binding Zn ribbon-like protein